MSIGPLAPISNGVSPKLADAETAAASSSPRSAAGAARAPDASSAEAVPQQQEDVDSRNSPKAIEIPQDVVEVHEDSQVKNQLIVEYLDQAHNVILQVPSTEELAVERGIAQELEQTAKLRSSASAASTPNISTPNNGEFEHGD